MYNKCIWYLMPYSIIFQLYVVISGENPSTRRKPPTMLQDTDKLYHKMYRVHLV